MSPAHFGICIAADFDPRVRLKIRSLFSPTDTHLGGHPAHSKYPPQRQRLIEASGLKREAARHGLLEARNCAASVQQGFTDFNGTRRGGCQPAEQLLPAPET